MLVVEDEAAILELARESLEQLGYTVLTAGSPEEAIRRTAGFEGPIHLLITDVVMPQMNGRQLCSAHDRRAPGAEVPVHVRATRPMSSRTGECWRRG